MVRLSFCMKRERSPAVFLSKELDTFLKSLGPDDKRVKWVGSMAVVLKENKFAGEPLKKSQIPRSYIEQYQVNNLFRYGHPEGYRSCYTIVNFCPHILDIMTCARASFPYISKVSTSPKPSFFCSKAAVGDMLYIVF